MSGAAVVVATNVIANAIKASGVVVEVSSDDFLKIVYKSEKALVVHAESKIIKTTHKYLTSYQGLAFYTKGREPLKLSTKVEVIEAKKMAIPEL